MGNLDAKRDWGFAGDYVEAMWLMLQQKEPDDYIIATAQTHSIREFLDLAFAQVGLDWNQYVEIDPRYFRPSEVDSLQGDSSKARKDLGWKPKITIEELVAMMIATDWKLAKQEKLLVDNGIKAGISEKLQSDESCK